jgi:UDP-N-acetylmuramyl pentapeptide phosphotransferase/UDP-N-acetylglucosamine-1-phosphate transferase
MNSVSSINMVILVAAAFLASLFGVYLFTRWSLRRELLDHPNERSSHSVPTPRGGGAVIVLVSLIGYAIVGVVLGLPVSWGYIVGALLVAGVSWLDDLYSLPFWSRLVVHMAAAGILISDLGIWSQISLPLISAEISLGGIFGVLLTVGWVVWLLNAYNFMDGIDGIAGTQAFVSFVAWGLLAWYLDLPSAFLFAGIVASTSAGFLFHNWQPAKIFMGDVGSAFLGFTLAAMPLMMRSEARSDMPTLPVIAVLFVWFFVFDTIFTFARRLAARRRVWEAHREHLYQNMVIEGREHSTVTLIYGIASAVLCASVLLGLILSGIYPWLAFLSLIVLTLLITYLGQSKKTLT